MKRVISIAMAVLMIAALLVACGGSSSSSSPEGKYVVKTIDGESVQSMIEKEAAGMSVDQFLEAAGISAVEEIVTIELKSDGTAVLTESIFGTTTEGTWKQNGDKITMTMGEDSMDFDFSGGELKATMSDMEYVFVKK